MLNEQSAAARAERLSRRRARMFPVLGLIYISQQFSFFARPHRMTEVSWSLDHLTISAWLVLTAVLLVGLSRLAFAFRDKEVRAIVDDETTLANRRAALVAGFWTMCWSALCLYLLSEFQPITVRTALHILLSAGIGVALLRFGRLELEAQRDG